MRTIVVGGSASNVGKTTLACELLRSAVEGSKIALKVSVHDTLEGPTVRVITRHETSTDRGDSKRLLQAGAAAVVWVTTGRANVRKALAKGLGAARKLRAELLVVESTAAGIHLHRASESWFIAGDLPWKPWAHEHLQRATHLRRTGDGILDLRLAH